MATKRYDEIGGSEGGPAKRTAGAKVAPPSEEVWANRIRFSCVIITSSLSASPHTVTASSWALVVPIAAVAETSGVGRSTKMSVFTGMAPH